MSQTNRKTNWFNALSASRRWRDLSLRAKLLVAFIGVTVITTSILSVFVVITTTNSLRANLERELSALAVNRATSLGELFNGQINNLTTLSLGEVLQQAVEAQNQAYSGDAATIQAEIDAKDAQWLAADAANNNADPLVQKHLANPAALDLIEYQKAFPDNAEVFITDIHGGLVGATNRTSDYNQADEAWWQAAYNNGQGAAYISTPQFDPSSGKIGIQFALPVRNRDTGKIIGILRTTYTLTPLAAIMDERIGQTGSADIFIPGETASRIRAGVLEPYEPQLLQQLKAATSQGMAEMNYEGDLSVVTQAPLQSLAGNPAIDKLDWIVVVHQARVEAFAPVNAQILGVIIVGLVVLGLAVLAAIFLARVLIRPLTQLTNTAQKIAAGNLSSQVQVTSSDEIGLLASAFNTMTARLRDFIGTLEERVAERTHSLELAAEVGRSVSQVRSLDVMLKDAAEIIRSRFDLYYVQVYLTDPSQTNLILQSGTGTVGAELAGRGHRLPLNTASINGRAAVEKRSVVISDTATSTTFRPNPLLPDTRSEMAMPLMVGERVVGVLDLQSNKAGSLSQDILSAFEALAGQLAIAIQNASLLAETEQARAEVEAQARRLVRVGWQDYLDAIHKPEQIGFMFQGDQVTSLTEAEQHELVSSGDTLAAPISVGGEKLGALVVEMEEQKRSSQMEQLIFAVARQVAQQIESLRLLDSAERYRAEAEQASRRLTREGWKAYTDANAARGLSYLYDLKEVRALNLAGDHPVEDSDFSLPLKVRDEAVGKLIVQGLEPDNKDALELVNAVAERLGTHIESLRQYDQTQSALTQSERLFEASRSVAQAADLQELLKATVETLNIPAISRAGLEIFDYNAAGELDRMTLAATWRASSLNSPNYEPETIGRSLTANEIKVLSLFVGPTPLFINDVNHDERVDPAAMQVAKKQNYRALATLPLFAGTQQIGIVSLISEEPHNFTQDEIRLFTALAPQIATVLENRRQFERAQQQAERESALNVISQKIQSATTVEAVLQIAARELGHALGAPMTIAQLNMKAKQ